MSMGRNMVLAKPKFGFRLKNLKKWAQMSSNDRRHNLMQYLVIFFNEMEPPGKDGVWYKTMLPTIRSAAGVNPVTLDNDVSKMQAELEAIKQALAEVPTLQRTQGVDDRFHATVERFVERSKAHETVEAYSSMYDEFEVLANFYCFDPFFFSFEYSAMELFFQDILGMCGVYHEANERVENAERQKLMKIKRAAAKKAMEEKKINQKKKPPSRRRRGKKNLFGEVDAELEAQMGGSISFADQLKMQCAARKKQLGAGVEFGGEKDKKK
eukprot:TRINITY_DN12650_c0_g1_i2.p1 TRINITY_DN12650_c0_g1~~TRINITY_DN12650_c0_g1_i2.p1  ORF type:complete len:268 (+),score=83.14 TRINITY_DN12650_c0_g1_i2:180-983(+)